MKEGLSPYWDAWYHEYIEECVYELNVDPKSYDPEKDYVSQLTPRQAAENAAKGK